MLQTSMIGTVREVASRDGTTKAVLHVWYRGEERLGAAYGTLAFDPASTTM